MGGGSYDRDVYSGSSSGGWDYASDAPASSRFDTAVGGDPLVTNLKREMVCPNENPIVVAMDVTGSMGIAAKVIYDKMPMFFGQIKIQDYLPDPAVSFAAIGDIAYDRVPVQICDFEVGEALDEWLERLYLEGGGGGDQEESYDMAAHFYLNKLQMTHPKKNPFFFFIGDEGFKSTAKSTLTSSFGKTTTPTDAEELMKQLNDAFDGHAFLIHKRYNYSSADQKIVRQWTDALGQENVLILEDPKSVVDVMLGAIALVSESRDMDSYIADLKGLGADPDRTQTPKRIKDVTKSLKNLSDHVESTALVKADVSTRAVAAAPKRKARKTKKKRVR
jgi:hypothetical protein